MTNTDVKQRITSLQALPVLPPLAREALVSLEVGVADWHELAAIATADEKLSGTLRAAAIRECATTMDAPLYAHLAGLGLPRICELLFRRIAPTLFDPPLGNGIDLAIYWAHAFDVARYARLIAHKTGSRYAPVAYMAGLLHDIGKPALDRVVPGGYTRALELVRQQGLYALEAERRELGADHTVAGKWLAECWGLPATYVAAIWLHHHPPGTLDNTPYPVELIEIVALANFLAHGAALDTSPQERMAAMDERRWMRLGLQRVDVIEMMRGDGGTQWPEPVAVDTMALSTTDNGTGDDAVRLRQERDYYHALCTLNDQLRPGLAPAGQLKVLIESLRAAFAIPAGLCYLTGDHQGAPVVLRWHSLTTPPEVVPLKSTGDGPGTAASLDELVAALSEPTGGETASAVSAIHRHGFMALPLLDNNKSVGQLIFQSGCGPQPFSEEFINALMRFMKAVGAALARCNAVRDASEEAESLAAAVWKQELSHRHDRKTERLISVGKMAAGAAHEINNPLAVISGKAQVLLGNAEREEDRKALEIIIEHSRRASGILRDLLQFARPNPPHFMPSRIGALLRAAVEKARRQLEDEGIQLIEDYAPDMPEVQADPVQMGQVFQNILKNAEQAMARQGDKLTVRARPNQDRTAVIIQFIDTGQGIAADVMDKVFEPFFTTQSGNEASGMGLAVCHGIVEAHRGTITLHSQEGAGTTCTLTLPVAVATAVAPQQRRVASARREGKNSRVERAPEDGTAAAAPTPRTGTAAARNTGPGTRSSATRRDGTAAAAPESASPSRRRTSPSAQAPESTPSSERQTLRADKASGSASIRESQAAPPVQAPESTPNSETQTFRADRASGAVPAPTSEPAAVSPLAPEVKAAMQARTESAPEMANTAASRGYGPEYKGRLLLVDHDSELREVLAEALRSRGYRVQTAADGLEALAEVIANRVDLVMLDNSVPGVNAPQNLVDEIQKRKSDLPVILLIGALAHYEAGPGSGPRQILRKPFEVAQLFRLIEESIAARHVA